MIPRTRSMPQLSSSQFFSTARAWQIRDGAGSLCAGEMQACRRPERPPTVTRMTKWEYATVPLMIHATKQILDNWGEDGWELVQVVTGPDGNGLVAYLKRPKA
jgi:hypothetical protein